MFYSAIAQFDINAVRKTDQLPGEADRSRWLPVPIHQGVALYFELLNSQTPPIGQIISFLTKSSVYHVETWLGDDADLELIAAAESRLGMPYDYEGALLAANDSGYHTPGKEFCSGLAMELLKPSILPGLSPYPNPGKLLAEVTGMTDQPMPKLAAPIPKLTDAHLAWLQSLVPDKIATGTYQQIMEQLA